MLDFNPNAIVRRNKPKNETQLYTLLELVSAVAEVSESEEEVVATLTYMLTSGRVQLRNGSASPAAMPLCG